jgi:UDP-N-acetylmuramoyl-tripeptide--D-alanyl-D-alanine ligase
VRGTKLALNLFSPRDLELGTGGRSVCRGEEHVVRVAIDSREVAKGDLFIPLKGERTDGHDYLAKAIERGVKAVLIAEKEWPKRKNTLIPLFKQEEVTCIAVPDTLKALQDLSNFHLGRIPQVFKIGITGSSGKTTTKEIMGAILAENDRTIITEGNLNSEIGVPLTAFKVDSSYKYAVFEMGINHSGEMDILADIVWPDLAVITNIGTAHIGLLGSEDAIASEKKKITKHFSDRQRLFLYEDEKYFKFLAKGVKGEVIACGPRSLKGLLGSEDLGLDGTIINWEELQIHFPLFGKHNYINALTAIAVAKELKIDRQEIKRGLEAVKPLFGRSEIIRGQVTIIKDCYNANPDSVAKALEFLQALAWKGRKVAVLGSMLELGGESEHAHKKLGKLVADLNLDSVFFLGKEAKAAFLACIETGFKGTIKWKESMEDLNPLLIRYIRPGDIILIKGSRGLELERILEAFK